MGLGQLESVRAGCEILVVAHGGRDAVELESDARRTGPGIRRGGIALDLSFAASFAGAHDW